MEKQKLKSIYAIITFTIILFFSVQNMSLAFNGVKNFLSMISPLINGGIIAFIFNIPMQKLENILSKKSKKSKRGIAYLITLLGFILFFVALISVVIPQVIVSLTQIISSLEILYAQLPMIYEEIIKLIPDVSSLIDLEFSELLSSVTSEIQNILGIIANGLTEFIGTIFDGVVNFVLAFIFSIYLLFSKESVYLAIKNVMYAAFKKEKMDMVYKIANLTNKSFSYFILGQATEAVIVGVIFLVALTVFNFDYAVLISTIISVGSLIPIFGSTIGCIIAMFFLATINLSQAVWFLILFIVIQQLEGNLIYPYVVGNKVGIPAILVFVSVILGGNFLGLIGMLTFIPISGVIYTLLKEFVEKKNASINEEISQDAIE